MTVRRMTVVRCPGTMDRPMIKIANSTLEDMGFEMGTAIEVSYVRRGEIIIRKLKDKHEPDNLQKQPAGPVSHSGPSASGRACATESTGHAEGGASNARACEATMRDMQSHRYVLRGQSNNLYAQNAGAHRGAMRVE